VLLLGLYANGQSADSAWTVVRNSHFEVFSQTSQREAEAAVVWLERLRAFFIQAGISNGDGDHKLRGPVRVVQFGSEKNFAAFRPSASADAFFLAGPTRDYVVLSNLPSMQTAVVAHEYAHLVLHSVGVILPEWLAEGLAEVFSTVSISDRECTIGGGLPLRRASLQHGGWIPLAALLSVDSVTRLDRQRAGAFYAEAWALADMLIFSSKYNARLPQLMGELSVDKQNTDVLTRIYGMSMNGIETDLRAWLDRPHAPVPLPAVNTPVEVSQASPVDQFSYRLMMADLFFAEGRLHEAKMAYQSFEKQSPNDATIHAALGSIALREGDSDVARAEWKRAMELGITDAGVCYRYANLAEDASVPTAEVKKALQRAVELAPDFDDARYKLGLVELHAGKYAEAVSELRRMKTVPPPRAYGYWTAMANALIELNERDEAKTAAEYAKKCAQNEEQRSSASLLAYLAATDLTVQIARDDQGQMQMVTARKPHGSEDWNPFIEAGDQIKHFEGKIRKVECSANKITGFEVASGTHDVKVSLPDPSRVMIVGGDPEFVCGAEDGRAVAIDFATVSTQGTTEGLLRGMRFQ
jgi:tetratricopeptide (TPR) repeat protein